MKRNKAEKTESEESVSLEHFNRHELMEKINPLIDNTLMRFGFIPVETELVKENKRWFFRIFMYSNERSVGIDDCERVSRSLADFLDELIPFKYNLEVSSPGLERKLKSDKEYLIFKGRDVNLKLKESIDGSEERQLAARIADFDENKGLTIYSYKYKKEILIRKENIISAKLYFNEIQEKRK